LAHDPNNTKWTSNTESFGLKMMTAQGWQPGDFLGAKDAKQAEHYTAGSASHIRVMIKEDNLGLGAKIGSGVGHGECTGLDAFKDLLGRLNGKEEDEIEKERKSREDLKRAIYSERKWGSTRFVRGGFLVGDKIQPLIEAEAERVRKLAGDFSMPTGDTSGNSSSLESDEKTTAAKKPKKSKKRKLEEAEPSAEIVAVKVKKSKKDRTKFDSKHEELEDTEEVKKPKKKSKKDRKLETDGDSTEDERKRRKREKKEKKARKEAVKLQAQSVTEAGDKQDDSTESSASSSTKNIKDSTLTSAPSSGYSTPIMQGRHAVRARNIAQKRLASMDVASLNQVSLLSYSDMCINKTNNS
jgi:Pin2-interacting protein X1